MAIHRYSLADYQLTIGFPTNVASALNLRDAYGNLITNFTIGGPGENGEGSFVGQISVNRSVNAFETDGDATGSWVHNKNNNKTGSISVSITQISDDIIRLIQLTQVYESIQENVQGLTLTINSSAIDETTPLVTGNDCFIQKLPNYNFQASAQSMEWSFTCGQILYRQ